MRLFRGHWVTRVTVLPSRRSLLWASSWLSYHQTVQHFGVVNLGFFLWLLIPTHKSPCCKEMLGPTAWLRLEGGTCLPALPWGGHTSWRGPEIKWLLDSLVTAQCFILPEDLQLSWRKQRRVLALSSFRHFQFLLPPSLSLSPGFLFLESDLSPPKEVATHCS